MQALRAPDHSAGTTTVDEVDLLVRLGKGLAHPSRAAILVACTRDGAGVHRPVNLARELRLPLGVVSYHVRALADLGLLVLKELSTVRGAVAHDYVAADGLSTALDALRGSTLGPPSDG